MDIKINSNITAMRSDTVMAIVDALFPNHPARRKVLSPVLDEPLFSDQGLWWLEPL